MINRISFCFGNLMVRRKKMPKGCRKKEKNAGKKKKMQKKSEIASCSHWNSLLFSQKQPSLVTEIVSVSL